MTGKILISTGGSGGHVIPAITIHDHLKENYDISISSDVRGLKYLDDKFYKILVIDTPKLNNLILFPLSILKVFFLDYEHALHMNNILQRDKMVLNVV